jgi:hypothetical protein
VGSSPDGCEELFSSWGYLRGYLHGEATEVRSKLILSMSTEKFPLWPLLALCNLPKAVMAVTEATSKPLRVLDLALQDSERDLSVKFRFV